MKRKWLDPEDRKRGEALEREVERLRAKVTELSDEAYEYAEEIERLKIMNREGVRALAEVERLRAEVERRWEEAGRWRDRAINHATGYSILREWEREDAARAAEKGEK